MASPYASSNDYLNDTSTFDYARKKASDQAAVELQARKDALARRFAALGNLDSGAQIKQEQLAQNEVANNLNNANEGINAQQNQELGRRKEVLQGQQFQSEEAGKGRDFAAQQAALQRVFGTSERLGGQEFTAGQGGLQRAYGTSERQAGQEFAAGQGVLQRAYGTSERLGSQEFAKSERGSAQDFATKERDAAQTFSGDQAKLQRDVQKDQFEKTYNLSLDQFAEAKKQFKDTYNEEVRVNTANMDFAQQALDKQGVLEKLLSGGQGSGLKASLLGLPGLPIGGGYSGGGGGDLGNNIVKSVFGKSKLW